MTEPPPGGQEEQLEGQLEQWRQQEFTLLDQLEALRLSETAALDLHGYRGTPQQIGEQLRAQEPQFEWVLDVNPVGTAAPLPDTDATRLLERLREVREDEARALRLHRPALSRLPSPEDFVQFARAEQQAQASVAARHEGRDALAFTPLADAPAPQREALLRALQDLQSQVTTARRRPSAWVPRAVDALLMGQWARWQDLMDRTQDLLPGLQKDAEWMDANVIAGHGGRAPEQIECRRPPEEGSRKACYLVNGPAGVVRKHLDDGLRPALKLLGDWSFTSGTESATYQTQTGQTMNLSVVYGGNDGYTLVDEPVPPGQGTLHVYAAPATP